MNTGSLAIFAAIISSSRAGRVMVRQRCKARRIAANIAKLPELADQTKSLFQKRKT
jgi:hypothetical protein